jgi:hypothetical protein
VVVQYREGCRRRESTPPPSAGAGAHTWAGSNSRVEGKGREEGRGEGECGRWGGLAAKACPPGGMSGVALHPVVVQAPERQQQLDKQRQRTLQHHQGPQYHTRHHQREVRHRRQRLRVRSVHRQGGGGKEGEGGEAKGADAAAKTALAGIAHNESTAAGSAPPTPSQTQQPRIADHVSMAVELVNGNDLGQLRGHQTEPAHHTPTSHHKTTRAPRPGQDRRAGRREAPAPACARVLRASVRVQACGVAGGTGAHVRLRGGCVRVRACRGRSGCASRMPTLPHLRKTLLSTNFSRKPSPLQRTGRWAHARHKHTPRRR